MNFTISKKDLLKELSYVIGALEKKNTLPVLQNIVFRSLGEQQIEIVATDLDLAIRCRCAAEVREVGDLLCQGRKLNEIVKALPDKPVAIKSHEQGALISCERSKFKVLGQPITSFPTIPEFRTGGIAIPSYTLRYLIEHTVFAATKEDSQRYALSSVQLSISNGSVQMVATDGHRLAFVKSDNNIEDKSVQIQTLIPMTTLRELNKHLMDGSDEVLFQQENSHLYFYIDDRLLISKQVTGQFPNYDPILPKQINYSIIAGREQLIKAIERVALFADYRSGSIKFKFANGQLELYSGSTENGEAGEVMPVQYDGPIIDIALKDSHLLQVLNILHSQDVIIGLEDTQKQIQLQPASTEHLEEKHIIMPMKI